VHVSSSLWRPLADRATRTTSSAYNKWLIRWPRQQPALILLSAELSSWMYKLNSKGDKTPPWRTPFVMFAMLFVRNSELVIVMHKTDAMQGLCWNARAHRVRFSASRTFFGEFSANENSAANTANGAGLYLAGPHSRTCRPTPWNTIKIVDCQAVLWPIDTDSDIAAKGRRIAVALKGGFPMVDDNGQNTSAGLCVVLSAH